MAYKYLTENGTIVADTSDTLTEVENEWKSILGNNLAVSPETVAGSLITAEAVARQQVIQNNADVANQINPNIAEGVFLDAIWALTGGSRLPATPTLVIAVKLEGVPSAIIPAGVRIQQSTTGMIFTLVARTILGPDGKGQGTFQSEDLGPISVPPGSLDTIVEAPSDLEKVYNDDTSIVDPGALLESDIRSRNRRRNTLGYLGLSSPQAVIAALYNVTGVRSLQFRENVTSESQVIDGITLKPHSLYVCVDGGIDTDIATALLRSKSLGCDWNGNTTIQVTEPYSGQIYPVTFDRAEIVEIYVRVTVRQTNAVADPAQVVRDAIIAYANGNLDGEEGFVVGGTVSAFELAGAVDEVRPVLHVRKVEISKSADTGYTTDEIEIAINQKANVFPGSIQVIIQ